MTRRAPGAGPAAGEAPLDQQRPRVLFVDDEVEVLHALRSALHAERNRWDLEFVTTAADALDLVEAGPVEVVVTDLRMPDIGGEALLRHLQDHHPHVVRLVLSGTASTAETLRSLPFVHRWLPKPTSTDQLVATIEDALATRDAAGRATDDRVDALVGGVTALPTPPNLYLELLSAIGSPGVTFDALAHLVERDPAVTAKVLQWGRSPLVAGGTCDTVHQVIGTVGVATLAQLVLSAEVLDLMGPEREIPGLCSEALRAHAELTAQLAPALVAPTLAAEARTAGLLHNVGLLVLTTRAHDALVRAVELARSRGVPLDEAETEACGVSHAEVGARLLALWGLAPGVVAAVRDHAGATLDPEATTLDLPAAIRVASALAALALRAGGGLDEVFVARLAPTTSSGGLAPWFERACDLLRALRPDLARVPSLELAGAGP